jgi:hypothetical protein
MVSEVILSLVLVRLGNVSFACVLGELDEIDAGDCSNIVCEMNLSCYSAYTG